MRGLLNSHGRVFGSTESGRAWCTKALHPSDPVGEIQGLPDQSARTVVMQSYTQVINIPAPAGSVGTWEGEVYFTTDPSAPVCFYTRDTGGAHTYNHTTHNTAWGNSVTDAATNFSNAFESWRVCYAGLTANLDATSLTNQGSVVACQVVAAPVDLGHVSGTLAAGGAAACAYNVLAYQPGDTPEYVQSAIMPNAYTGLAREGVYMPLRLDSNHQRWWTPSEARCMDVSGLAINTKAYKVPSAAWPGLIGDGFYPATAGAYFDPASGWNGDVHLRPCTNLIGAMCFVGLHLDATIRLTFRIGVEGTVEPGTALTPYQHESAEYDPVAVDTYYAIARKMKDAYPASFNDLGKLWGVIKQIATFLGPSVREIPVVGPSVAAIASQIGRSVDRAMAKSALAKREKQKAKPLPPGFLGKH